MDTELRLLIVDDSPRARDGLSAFFSVQEGLKVICEASNGEEALAKVESQHPDLVLMDLQMPVMGGLQATQIIKERWPHVRVVILTIYTDYGLQARQAGADAFLIKGCSTEEMRAALCAIH
jgi:YesN/AraC family two-component response regulator